MTGGFSARVFVQRDVDLAGLARVLLPLRCMLHPCIQIRVSLPEGDAIAVGPARARGCFLEVDHRLLPIGDRCGRLVRAILWSCTW